MLVKWATGIICTDRFGLKTAICDPSKVNFILTCVPRDNTSAAVIFLVATWWRIAPERYRIDMDKDDPCHNFNGGLATVKPLV